MTQPDNELSADRPADTGTDDPFLQYFEGEMRYLREAGKEFASAHPEKAQKLGYGTPGALDDSVEALYEGFAFLTARLRMKLDDTFPEITDPLVDHLWPYASRTIPSLAILEMTPQQGEARTLSKVPAGMEVCSTPIGPDGTVCVYRTTQPVQLLPLAVTDAGVRLRPDGRTVIHLAFALTHGEPRVMDDLSRIRLYLDGDRMTASALYSTLTRQVTAIGVRMPRVLGGELRMQQGLTIESVGMGPETRLWPTEHRARDEQLDREQTMLEYFTFPEKFHFIDLCGFDSASVPVGETRFALEIELDGAMPSQMTFDASNVRLFCTPVINLFEVDAQAIQPDGHSREYRVVPAHEHGANIEPYDVLSVAALDPQLGTRHEYLAFKEFRHRGGMMQYESPERYFHTSMRHGVTGKREMWISLDGTQWKTQGLVPDKHVAVRTLANNERLPRMALRASMLTEPVSAIPGVTEVRNISTPTMPLHAPRDGHYPWRVIAHFCGGGTTELHLMTAETFRAVLGLYDWTGSEDNRQRIDAIEHVWLDRETQVRGGRVCDTVNLHVGINPAGFAGAGDTALFADVLHQFVGRYADVHYAIRLVFYEGVGGPVRRYPETKMMSGWL
ncbi:type VI secretion system baseplate subunit TssF [Pandoraea sp.]|uniref:type VI secretion system baseplate subunit TssF n=1 Tax=Pandoraea sp. TaxID=1883445 RepID=UPI0035B2C5F0